MTSDPERPVRPDACSVEPASEEAHHDGEQARACEALLALVAEEPGRASEELGTGARQRITGLVVGRLIGFDGGPLVSWPGEPTPKRARSIAKLGPAHLGRELALLFAEGDPARPVIVGVIEPCGVQATAEPKAASDACAEGEPVVRGDPAPAHLRVEAVRGGQRVTLTADHEIVLRCGEASITLTRAGKIILKGAYVVTHSTGVNRIRGATVQIN